MKWFQNHSYAEKKCIEKPGKKRKSLSLNNSDTQTSEDEEAVEAHLSELKREFKKKQFDKNKVTRLLSFTFTFRREEILSKPGSTRVSYGLQMYPCLHDPQYVSISIY